MSENVVTYDPQTSAEPTIETITLQLDKHHDAAVLQKLHDVPDAAEYILSLIRQDLAPKAVRFT